MIVITAPTGQIGSELVKRLLQRSEPIRVIVRDPAKLADEVRQRVEIVQGSHADPAVVSKAFEGADSLFWLPPGEVTAPSAHAAYVEFSQPAAAALANSSITRVVGVSALGRGWPTDAGHVTATLAADDLFAATGVAYRALACGSLMENTLRQLGSIRSQGMFFGPADGDRQGTAVATTDVADCAAALLRDSAWRGVAEVPLKGPEAISANEMAATMSDVLGRPVSYHRIDIADLRTAMIGQGVTVGMADATVALIEAKAAGLDELAKGPTPALTPTTFTSWCRTVLRLAVEG